VPVAWYAEHFRLLCIPRYEFLSCYQSDYQWHAWR